MSELGGTESPFPEEAAADLRVGNVFCVDSRVKLTLILKEGISFREIRKIFVELKEGFRCWLQMVRKGCRI